MLPLLVMVELTKRVAAFAFPLLVCTPATLVSSSESIDVIGVSGTTDSLVGVKTGDIIESGVVVSDSAAIRIDLRVTLAVMAWS